MKKILLLFSCMTTLLSLSISAQIKIGIEAGANISHFKHSSSAGTYQTEKTGGMKAGFQLGAAVDYEFKSHWMLMSGLSLKQTQSSMSLANSRFPNTNIRTNSLIIPLKAGYNIHLNDKISLIPFIGIYGSYNFNAGKSSLEISYLENGKTIIKHSKWNPMKGYSHEIPSSMPYPYTATIQACRNWTYGATGGVKVILYKHYTASFSYFESIKKNLKKGGLRNYGFEFNIGYQF